MKFPPFLFYLWTNTVIMEQGEEENKSPGGCVLLAAIGIFLILSFIRLVFSMREDELIGGSVILTIVIAVVAFIAFAAFAIFIYLANKP